VLACAFALLTPPAAASAAPAEDNLSGGSVIGGPYSVWPKAATDRDYSVVAFQRPGEGIAVRRFSGGSNQPDALNTLNAPGGGAIGGGPDAIAVAAEGLQVHVAWLQMTPLPEPDTGSSVELWLASSDDGGDTFRTPVQISEPDSAAAWGPRLAVTLAGVVVLYGEHGLQAAFSDDRGTSFVIHQVAQATLTDGYAVTAAENDAYIAYATGNRLEVLASRDGGRTFSGALQSLGLPSAVVRPPVLAADGESVYVLWGEAERANGQESGSVEAAFSPDEGRTWQYSDLATCAPASTVSCDSYDVAFRSGKAYAVADSGPIGEVRLLTAWSGGPGEPLQPPVDVGGAVDVTHARIAVDDMATYVAWSNRTSFDSPWWLTMTSRWHSSAQFRSTYVLPDGGGDAVGSALTAYDGNYALAYMNVAESGPGLTSQVMLRTGSVTDGDVELVDVQAVQGPYDDTKLVAGKPLAIRVRVRSGLPAQRVVPIRVTYRDGDGPIQVETLSRLVKPGVNTFFLPEPGEQILVTPGEFTLETSVDPENAVEETDETNNDASRSYPVKDTRPFRIIVVPLGSPDEPAPTCRQTEAVAEAARQYIAATYPVDPDELGVYAPCSPQVTKGVGPFEGALLRSEVIAPLDALNPDGSYDQIVGVVPPGWLTRNLPGNVPTAGVALLGSDERAVVVDAQAGAPGATVAHEIAHQMGWVPAGEPGRDEAHGAHLPAVPQATGYWVDRRIDVTAPDFMYWQSMSVPEQQWVSLATHRFLFERLAVDPVDPPLLWLQGTVAPDGTVQTGAWFAVDGYLDAELGDRGEVDVRYLDADGTEIGRTAFDLSHEIADAAPEGTSVPLDPAGFSVRIPDVPGAAEIALERDGETLFTREKSANPPSLHVTSPSGSAAATPGTAVTVSWTGGDADGDALTYSVLTSRDGGTTWLPVAAGLDGTSHTFPVGPATTGGDLRVKVVASDGWNTVEALSPGAFTVEATATTGSVAFVQADDTHRDGRLWLRAPDGSLTQVPTPNWAGAPAWAPDGSRIAFLMHDHDASRAVWSIAPDGSDLRRLFTIQAGGLDPNCLAWSPDGRSILTVEHEGAATNAPLNLYRHDVDTGSRTLVAADVDHCASWSPDGRTVAFTRAPSPEAFYLQIYTVDLATGAERMLTNASGTYGAESRWMPAYSPDGSTIAYLAYGSGFHYGQKVWLMNADGTGPRVLGPVSACNWCGWPDVQTRVSWSAAGDAVYAAVRSQAGVTDLWRLPANGSAPQQLTSHTGRPWAYTQPSVQILPATGGGETGPTPLAVDVGGPYTTGAGTPVTLTATATGDGASTATFAWDLDGDGSYDDATGPTTEVSFPGSGEFPVGVLASADDGTATDATTVGVANVAPALGDLTATSYGDLVAVEGTASDSGDDVLTARVEWGDGTADDATLVRDGAQWRLSASHRYAGPAAGASLVVTLLDGAGGSDSRTLVVAAARPNSAPTLGDITASTIADTPASLAVSPSDADGDGMRLLVTAAPAHGTVRLLDVPLPTPEPAMVYVPDPGFVGTDTFRVVVDDGQARSPEATIEVTVAPRVETVDCAAVSVTPASLWPPNGRWVTAQLVADPSLQLGLEVTAVTQDEPLTARRPDARPGAAAGSVQLRAERAGAGDGRVYRIAFRATGPGGGSCSGVAVTTVPHDAAHPTAGDSGLVADSFGGG
jgi:Tol biopolymer transport system component